MGFWQIIGYALLFYFCINMIIWAIEKIKETFAPCPSQSGSGELEQQMFAFPNFLRKFKS